MTEPEKLQLMDHVKLLIENHCPKCLAQDITKHRHCNAILQLLPPGRKCLRELFEDNK